MVSRGRRGWAAPCGCIMRYRVLPFFVLVFVACTGIIEADSAEGILRVFFERSGGFAGIRIATTIDAANLSPEQVEKLKQLIQDADFFHLPAVIASHPPQPDRFQYKIEVDQDGQQHVVVVGEASIPAGLRPLVTWLMDLAKRRTGRGS
jgi:hypothetical protein